jgi:hypothetical protein
MEVGFTVHNVIVVIVLIFVMMIFFNDVSKW